MTDHNKTDLRVSAVLSVFAMTSGHQFKTTQKPSRPDKPCLTCGTMHNHNNAYCSAECCRAHR